MMISPVSRTMESKIPCGRRPAITPNPITQDGFYRQRNQRQPKSHRKSMYQNSTDR